jgi:hypothetical protein
VVTTKKTSLPAWLQVTTGSFGGLGLVVERKSDGFVACDLIVSGGRLISGY